MFSNTILTKGYMGDFWGGKIATAVQWALEKATTKETKMHLLRRQKKRGEDEFA